MNSEIIQVSELNVSGLYYIDNIPIDDVIKELDNRTWIPLTNSSNSRCVQRNI